MYMDSLYSCLVSMYMNSLYSCPVSMYMNSLCSCPASMYMHKCHSKNWMSVLHIVDTNCISAIPPHSENT